MHCPHTPHWQAIRRILRYLRATADFALHFSSTSSPTLTIFCDTDWAGYPDNCKSTSGLCILFGSHLVSWGSKKQPTIAHSSSESEYKSIANTTCELNWLQSLLKKLSIFLTTPLNLFCDNIGAIYLSVNLVLHSRTKHVNLDYKFLRDRVAAKTLHV